MRDDVDVRLNCPNCLAAVERSFHSETGGNFAGGYIGVYYPCGGTGRISDKGGYSLRSCGEKNRRELRPGALASGRAWSVGFGLDRYREPAGGWIDSIPVPSQDVLDVLTEVNA